MRYLILLVFLISTNLLPAQNTYCEGGYFNSVEYQITAPSGLRMRSAPSTNANIVVSIPEGEFVLECDGEKAGPYETIEEIKGRWRLANYKGFQGYLFDGFMKEIPRPDIVGFIPNMGIGNIWQEQLELHKRDAYYGLFLVQDEQYNPGPWFNSRSYKFQKLEDQNFQVKGALYYQVDCSQPAPILVLSGMSLPIDRPLIGSQVYNAILPGEIFPLEDVYLFAEGKPVRSKNSFHPYPFDRIDDYVLKAIGTKEGAKIEQVLLKRNLYAGEGIGYEGNFHIHFAGDIDGDGREDFLFSSGSSYKGWDYVLFLTKTARKGELFRPVVIGGDNGC